jgi:hypothetical protein
LLIAGWHTRISAPEPAMTDRIKYSFVGLIAIVLLAGGLYRFATAPMYSYHLFCTFREIYRVNATIEVDGRRYEAEVVRQTTTSRDWIRNLNSAGCSSTHGTALVFRLADDRVVILRSTICNAGSDALKKTQQINVADYCESIQREKPRSARDRARIPNRRDGYIVARAEHPATWAGFFFGQAMADNTVVNLVSVTASIAYTDASDRIDQIAPNILKSTFTTSLWYDSPEAVITYERRRKYYNSETKKFPFTVSEQK